jgi:hypothetical protein
MRFAVYLTIIAMLAIALGACGGVASQPGDGPINPGDKIGGFLVTTAGDGDVTYNWELDSAIVQQGSEEVYAVHIPVGTKINVSVGIFDPSFSGKLDSLWSGHTYEMFINDRPVNLEAFGAIDVSHPAVGKMRYWNVVLVASEPGEITVAAKGAEASGTPINDTKIYTFSGP